jgi:peptide/nickel transport system permease protein
VLIALLLLAVLGLFAWVVRTAGWRFAARRFGQALVVIVLVTFGTLWLLNQLPGDPCITALGTAATEEAVAQCTQERKLDQSVFVQYADWVGDILRGDLGPADYASGIELSTILGQRLPKTFALFVYSQLLALAIAIPLGIWSAYQSGRRARGHLPSWSVWVVVTALFVGTSLAGWALFPRFVVAVFLPLWLYHAFRGGPAADRWVGAQAFVLLAIPVFVLGETLRYQFAIEWSWYELKGYVGPTEGLGPHLKSVWLPVLVLALSICPVYLRLLRADMVQNLQQDFVLVARAKGLPNRRVLLRHVLRPSTLTLLTVLGLNIAQLVNGAIVVEFIYDLDGMGSYLIDAVASRSFFPVQTIVALVAVLFVLANMVIDLVYTAVDPRVPLEAPR